MIESNDTRYRAAKRYASADGSSMEEYRWCRHLANACEVASTMPSLPFGPLLVAVYGHAAHCPVDLTSNMDFLVSVL